jgi:hypothetical protein
MLTASATMGQRKAAGASPPSRLQVDIVESDSLSLSIKDQL